MRYDEYDSRFIASSDTEAWERVGDAIIRRRAELGINQRELASKAKLSIQPVSWIEKAHKDRYAVKTIICIEDALDWAPNSIERILFDNEEPIPLEIDPLRERNSELEDEVKELSERVRVIEKNFERFKRLMQNL